MATAALPPDLLDGARLGITTRTVAFHKSRLMEKLGVRSTAEFVRIAAHHRFV